MISRQKAFRLTDQILRKVGRRVQAEVILTARDEALTRFAGSEVIQNVASRNLDVSLRIREGNRVGRASTCCTDEASLNSLIQRTREGLISGMGGERLLPLVRKQRYAELSRPSGPRHLASPEGREKAVKTIFSVARRHRLEAAGIASREDGSLTLANSRGIRANHRISSGRISMTLSGRQSSGWADVSGPEVTTPGQVKVLAEYAAQRCLLGRRPKRITPGPYTVILEPACIGDLLQFMAWYGFGAQVYQEGQSFLSGRMGKLLFSKMLSIEDNVFHPKTLGFPFDFEGIPRRRMPLIERGICRGVVYDRRTARRAHTQSSGHGLPEPNELGPIPLNLVVKGGDLSLEEMIRGTERGLLITHFHYTNVMDPKRLILTGLTRDGVFSIENGRIRHPVQNLRFTQSLLEAFARIESVGSDQVYTEGFFGGGFVVPALKIRDFNFTSLAEAEDRS